MIAAADLTDRWLYSAGPLTGSRTISALLKTSSVNPHPVPKIRQVRLTGILNSLCKFDAGNAAWMTTRPGDYDLNALAEVVFQFSQDILQRGHPPLSTQELPSASDCKSRPIPLASAC